VSQDVVRRIVEYDVSIECPLFVYRLVLIVVLSLFSLSTQGLVLAVPVTACLLKVLMKDSNEKALESADAAQGSSANFRPA